jgi:predicted GTPase
MLKKCIAVAILTLTAHSAMAQDATAAQLANSLHLTERIVEMKATSIRSQQRQIDQMLAQLEKSVPNMNPAQRDALRAAATKMLTQVMNSWSSEEASRIYTAYLTAQLPAEAVSKTIGFYSSPEGQKALVVIGEAEKAMVSYITSSSEKAMGAAYPVFMNDMKAVVAPPAPAAK